MLWASCVELRNWNEEIRPIAFQSRELPKRIGQVLRDSIREVLLTRVSALVRQR
jgi:hypothetical protein